MLFRMVCSQSYKRALCKRVFVGTVQKRKENQAVVLRLNRCSPFVCNVIYGALLLFCFLFFIAHQIADKPFHISSRGRAAFFYQIIARDAEHGI